MTFARRSIIARASRSGSRSPTPAAWLRTRFTWSSARRSGGIAISESLPKPVVTPYATAPLADEAIDDRARRRRPFASARSELTARVIARDRRYLFDRERIAVDNDLVRHARNVDGP